jgi:superfamily II DNA or RNA helicase
MFRRHQDAFGQLCHDIRTGKLPEVRRVVCSVTPGGGKSLIPLIAASQLIPAIAEKICWVVPRRALQLQAEAEFLAPRGRALLGHNHTIRRSTNQSDPARGLSGFVTTYQAIGVGNHHLRESFASSRYILVLDEPHHVEEGGAWESALAPLVARAALTVYMSGTLERGNRQRIAFLPYRETSEGEVVDLSNTPHARSLAYSRADALLDRAVLPIHFELLDGTAEWIGRDGETYATTLSGAHKDVNEALYTALKTQFAEHLLNECVAHWSTHRASHPRSKLLVVTANIEDAKKYVEHLQTRGIAAAIATSDDSALAARHIAMFKRERGARSLDALVTVAMAYEGLDVPAITHIACLTHIRSKPWIEQMIARATRYDPEAGSWDEQTAFIYVPDDRLICNIIGAMQDEQQSIVKLRRVEDDEPLPRGESTPVDERSAITPVGSGAVGRRWDRVGLQGAAPAPSTPALPTRPPSEIEAEMRAQIQELCRRADAMFHDSKWGEANKRVVKTFGKNRAAMQLAELEKVLVWIEQNYRLRPPRAPVIAAVPPKTEAPPVQQMSLF